MNEPTDEAVDAPVETESVESEPVETEQLDYETERPEAYLRSPIACPTDIETLTALILRDIPDYTNRVFTANRRGSSPIAISIVLLATASLTNLIALLLCSLPDDLT